MLRETFFKEYPVRPGTNTGGTNASSLQIAPQYASSLLIRDDFDEGFEYWIQRNARVNLPASQELFKNYILKNLKSFFADKEALYCISLVNLFPDRIVIMLASSEVIRREVDYEVANERYIALRVLHGLPPEEGKGESEDETDELWFEASQENDEEYAARMNELFPELNGHWEEIEETVEVYLTGKTFLHLTEKISRQVADTYNISLGNNNLSLKIQRRNGYHYNTLFDGSFAWKDVRHRSMIGMIRKDWSEIHEAMLLGK